MDDDKYVSLAWKEMDIWSEYFKYCTVLAKSGMDRSFIDFQRWGIELHQLVFLPGNPIHSTSKRLSEKMATPKVSC